MNTRVSSFPCEGIHGHVSDVHSTKEEAAHVQEKCRILRHSRGIRRGSFRTSLIFSLQRRLSRSYIAVFLKCERERLHVPEWGSTSHHLEQTPR
jgi:hypothetical protein